MAVRALLVQGAGARPGVTRLLADPRVRAVDSPRHADVMLVAGAVPRALGSALRAVRDQLAPPRAVCWWTAAPTALPGVPDATCVGAADPVPALVAAAQGPERSLLGADEPPTQWRGVGPHGQGGEGMMGGSPYGRPMVMTGPDLRDGLALDRLDLRVGPLLSPLPTGLTLDVTLQGDLVVDVAVANQPFASSPTTWEGGAPPGDLPGWPSPDGGDPRIAAVEIARARHHLGAVARTLRLAGLDALGRRTARLAAADDPPDARRVRALSRWLRRTTALRWLLAGVGGVGADVAGAGPVARAAGASVDARADDPAYRRLGFDVVVQPADRNGDALSRLHQRLDEAQQALDLAAAATSVDAAAATTSWERVEGPSGRLATVEVGTRLLDALPSLLVGMEWGDAVTTVDSLDLDLTVMVDTPRQVDA